MTYRLLLDENVEYGLGERLAADGHDVEHVVSVPVLGGGADDDAIGRYSRAENRLILTYDDDFVLELDSTTFRGVLYVADASLGGPDLARGLRRMANQYPQAEVAGVEYVDQWI